MKKCIGTVARQFSTAPAEYFLNDWEKLILYNSEHVCGPNEYIHYTKGTVSYHELGRAQCVEDMRGDWLFMLDTDHMFAPDILDRLLFLKKKHNCLVISGIYQYKFPPHAPVANVWQSPDPQDSRLNPILDWDRKAEIIPIGSVGAGVLLVDRKVFSAIQKDSGENPFGKINGLSEDYSFFYRLKKLGIVPYLAPKIQCHHVISVPLSVDDYSNLSLGKTVSTENGKIIV